MFRQDLVSRLEEVSLAVEKARTRIYAENGLRAGQARVISALIEYGDLSQADLARLIDISAPTVKRLVEGLAKEGFVSYRISDSDKRINIIELTPKGKAQEEVLQRCGKELAALICTDFSEPEIIMTGLLMTRISENLKTDQENQ